MNALRQIISLFVLTAVAGGMSAAVVVSDTIISRGDTLRVPFAGAVAERSIEVRGATGGNTRGATWSVTLADSIGSERLRATLSFGNINDDPFFKPYLRLSVDTIVPGDVWHEVSSAEFTGHVDLYGGANSLTFRQHDGLLSVGAGGDRLMPGVTVPYGYDITSATVAGSRRLKIEYVAVSSRPDRRRALMTGWTHISRNRTTRWRGTGNISTGIWTPAGRVSAVSTAWRVSGMPMGVMTCCILTEPRTVAGCGSP